MSTEEQKSRPKPCCVCLDERKLRDECLLYKGLESGKCADVIKQYTDCMIGYGFKPNEIPKA
ncbi:uncharacterized protein SPAPADRAFT_135768 [Spathaspora passalidarum NRRL Y-27907]|uniref:Cytochrome c oxidase copper chaperone n=1 Tax=Spathaspora passalidarum (strain NRRL Y-27907 / 11-Y1) TaxID=619300 RepID=G3AK87_SPAPN|nr:uncharacterized protein SPAPADRAFT_135768 [Spathaspora passalidarum NRRL Y-27907]EGW33546.1 hypothetical protein SPAPADRAFT_135768 [Spathaspora passalidarum NRRL Y-27907]